MWIIILGVGFVLFSILSPKMQTAKVAEKILEEGYIHYEKGEYGQAIPKFLKVVKISPDHKKVMISALFNLGYSYGYIERYNFSILAFKRLIKDYPDEEEAKDSTFYVATCYQDMGKYDKALETYEDFIKKTTLIEFIIDTNFQKVNCYFLKKDYDKGFELLKSLQTKYRSKHISMECDFSRFCSYWVPEMEKKKKRRRIKFEPEKQELSEADKEAIGIIEGRIKEEKKVKVKKAKKVKIDKRKEKRKQKKLSEKAKGEVEKKKYKSFKQAVNIYKNGQWLTAVESLDKLTEKYPDYTQAVNFVKKIKQEAKLVAKEKFKNREELYYMKGFIFYHEGKIDKAVEYWEKLLEINPKNEEIKKYINKYR